MKQVCNSYATSGLQTNSFNWGTENEDCARKAYMQVLSRKHQNFKFSLGGFVINSEFGHTLEALLMVMFHAVAMVMG